MSHPNALLTVSGRRLLCLRVSECGWTVTRAAHAAGVSRQTAHKWPRRFFEHGGSLKVSSMVPPEPVDAIIFQAERTYDLRRVAELTKQVRHGGVLWVLWPTTERRVSEAHVERAGNAAGMTRTRITGVTGRFTGMKFIHRFADGR